MSLRNAGTLIASSASGEGSQTTVELSLGTLKSRVLFNGHPQILVVRVRSAWSNESDRRRADLAPEVATGAVEDCVWRCGPHRPVFVGHAVHAECRRLVVLLSCCLVVLLSPGGCSWRGGGVMRSMTYLTQLSFFYSLRASCPRSGSINSIGSRMM